MSERDGYQAGVPCWVDTGQPDPEAAVRFYGALFGWEFVGPGRMPGNPPGKYFVAQLRGRDVAAVGSQPAEAPPAPAWNTYIRVESADDSAKKVRSAGGGVVVAPFDASPAGRMAVFTDPQGALFCAWEAQDREGAQLINESGAWAMSILNTSDPERAERFYAAVFGWSADTLGGDSGEVTLWRLKGYVGGEPKQPVPRDVVAVMAPMGGEQLPNDTPSHWSVNFWVDDADATAGKAAELGGRILVAPFDTPVSRDAVIADAQGAVFSVSNVPGP